MFQTTLTLARPLRMRLAMLLLVSAATAAPVSLRLDAEAGLRLLPALAYAKDGDRGGDDSGDHGGGDRGDDGRDDDREDDDRGSHGRDDDDRGPHDRSGYGRGRDDPGTDDHGGQDRRHNSRPSGTVGGGMMGGGQVGTRLTEIERSARGIEVTYADGWCEELKNGRYELKDAQGRTVIERTATDQDAARLSSFSR